jgi:hypothetical protein
MVLYCPYCGGELAVLTAGELECGRGGMQLSKDLERRLRDVFEYAARPPKKSPFDQRSGGWFCPSCALRIERAADGDHRCPNCNRTIGEFVHALIELHPHRGGQADA